MEHKRRCTDCGITIEEDYDDEFENFNCDDCGAILCEECYVIQDGVCEDCEDMREDEKEED